MSGAISIPNYSDSNRVPGFYFAVDGSKANTGVANTRVLAVGQMLTGSALPSVASISAGLADAQAKYGPGSQAAHLVARYRQIDSAGELWVLPLADDAGAAKAAGKYTITGTAAVAGTLPLYIGDRLVATAVNSGDTAAVVATNALAVLTADPTLPVTATAAAGVLNLTSRNGGLCGNDLQLGVAVLGTLAGEAIPAGLTVAITAMAGGTQNPTSLAAALASLGDKSFALICHPYSDTASLNALQTFLGDTTGRWQPVAQLFGHAIGAVRGNLATVTAFGNARNDQHASIMPMADSPSSPLAWAAQLTAQTALSMRDNPARPVADLALTVLPPSQGGHFVFNQRASLLYDGLSTHRIDDSGTVYIERMVTTYQVNPLGLADNSYLDIETLLVLQTSIPDLKAFLAGQFSRNILVADGTKIPAGAPATTAQLVGAAVKSRYRYQAGLLWVQDPDGFAADLVATNVGGGVVKLLLPYRISNQLRIVAANCQFNKP